jgi:hypothetical protein
LPAPFSPSSARVSPRMRSNETSSMATVPPNRLLARRKPAAATDKNGSAAGRRPPPWGWRSWNAPVRLPFTSCSSGLVTNNPKHPRSTPDETCCPKRSIDQIATKRVEWGRTLDGVVTLSSAGQARGSWRAIGQSADDRRRPRRRGYIVLVATDTSSALSPRIGRPANGRRAPSERLRKPFRRETDHPPKCAVNSEIESAWPM